MALWRANSCCPALRLDLVRWLERFLSSMPPMRLSRMAKQAKPRVISEIQQRTIRNGTTIFHRRRTRPRNRVSTSIRRFVCVDSTGKRRHRKERATLPIANHQSLRLSHDDRHPDDPENGSTATLDGLGPALGWRRTRIARSHRSTTVIRQSDGRFRIASVSEKPTASAPYPRRPVTAKLFHRHRPCLSGEIHLMDALIYAARTCRFEIFSN